MPFTLIAHRGYSSEAPENTFEAFDLALEHGFNNFEMDVQLTRSKSTRLNSSHIQKSRMPSSA